MKAVLEGGSTTEPGDYNVKLVIASLSLAAGQVSHALSSSIHRRMLERSGQARQGLLQKGGEKLYSSLQG